MGQAACTHREEKYMTKEEIQRRLEEAWREPASPASRRLACLLGGALGDALGYRVEFQRWAEIEREYGPDGIRLAACKGPLVVSDDTQMTLFTLEGMARAKSIEDIVPEVREGYLLFVLVRVHGHFDVDLAVREKHLVGRQAGGAVQQQLPGSNVILITMPRAR